MIKNIIFILAIIINIIALIYNIKQSYSCRKIKKKLIFELENLNNIYKTFAPESAQDNYNMDGLQSHIETTEEVNSYKQVTKEIDRYLDGLTIVLPENYEEIVMDWVNGKTTVKITCQKLGISNTTLYKRFGHMRKK